MDNSEMDISSLDAQDARAVRVKVAGPAALLVAKLHKIWERRDSPHRLIDKDAHDAFRLLRSFDTGVLERSFHRLLRNEVSAESTRESLAYLKALFVDADSLGAEMAGRAEEGVGDPDVVSQAVSSLARDLLEAVQASED